MLWVTFSSVSLFFNQERFLSLSVCIDLFILPFGIYWIRSYTKKERSIVSEANMFPALT